MLISIPCAFNRSVQSVEAILRAAIGVMHETSLNRALRKSHTQCGQCQIVLQCPLQRPTNHPARAGIQDDSQEHEFLLQTDVGDIRHPELVDIGHHHPTGQVRIHFPSLVGIGGDDEFPFTHAQQVIFPQDAVDALWIHCPALPP